MTYIALGGLGVLAIVGAAIYVMRGSDKKAASVALVTLDLIHYFQRQPFIPLSNRRVALARVV